MAKPSDLPEWDTTQVNSIAPDATHKAQGWLAPGGVPEKPPFQTFNHWQNAVYRWVKYIDEIIESYASLAALRAITFTPIDGQIVSVLGYYANTENREWSFQWDSSDLSVEVTRDPQSGIYVALDSDPTGASGAFVRRFTGDLEAQWFGVVMDGNIVGNIGTDNTAAIQAAVDYAHDGTVRKQVLLRSGPGFGVGHCKVGTAGTGVVIKSGVKLKGDGPYSTLIFAPPSFAGQVLKTIEGGIGQPPGGIYDLGVLCFNPAAAATGIFLDANGSQLENIWTGGFSTGGQIVCNSTTQILTNIVLDSGAVGSANGLIIKAPGCQASNVLIFDQLNSIIISDVTLLRGISPIMLSNVSVIQPQTGGTGILISTNNGVEVNLSQINLESTSGEGYENGGVLVLNSSNVTAENISVWYPVPATASQIGLDISTGCTNVNVTNFGSINSGSGFNIASSSCSVVGGTHLDTVTIGGEVQANLSYVVVDSVTVRNPTTTGFVIGGGQSNVIQNNKNFGGVTGFIVDGLAGSTSQVKNNTSQGASGDAFSFTGTTLNVLSVGNTDTNGFLGAVLWNPVSLAAGERTGTLVTVAGAVLGDFVLAAAPYSLQSLTMTCEVSAANQATINLVNNTTGAVDLAEGVWKVKLVK